MILLVSLVLAFATEEIRLEGWTALVDRETLAIRIRLGGDEIQATQALSPAAGRTATFTPRGRRLHIRIESSREQSLAWPQTGLDPQLSALILPEGEGLYVPFADAAWRTRLAGRCYSAHAGLSLPFWSYQTAKGTLTFHVPTDLRTELCLEAQNGRLQATAKHAFLDRDQRPAYEVEIWPGGPSPIAPALEYRSGLNLVPLTRKTPHAAPLFGAIHMYVWGDGRTPEFIADLKRLGFGRAWLGYDQNEATHKSLIGAAFTAAAKAAGYLIGPYDTWANAQNPALPDVDFVSKWPGRLYPDGCIVRKEGRPQSGFANRGCELSSEALQRLALAPLRSRLDFLLRHHANSYFLDVDAFGELHDDYSPAHPMTQFQDRDNRLRRLRLARDRNIVLGSEHGVAWSVPVIDFAHGAHSVQNALLWPKKKEFGGWWPPDRPRIFFQPVDPGAGFSAAKYDPAFRLPLYEAAFHDAVVATDRWDLPMAKFPSLLKRRQLLELLYGVPSIWAMDRRQLRESQAALVKLREFFEPLHREIGPLPLTAFEWLSEDRLVQRTTFGHRNTKAAVTLTADFHSGCIEARWLPSNQARRFCP